MARHRTDWTKVYERKCNKCGEVKQISEFYRVTSKGKLVGYHQKCKKCHNVHYQPRVSDHRSTPISSTATFVYIKCRYCFVGRSITGDEKTVHIYKCGNPEFKSGEFIIRCINGDIKAGECALLESSLTERKK